MSHTFLLEVGWVIYWRKMFKSLLGKMHKYWTFGVKKDNRKMML